MSNRTGIIAAAAILAAGAGALILGGLGKDPKPIEEPIEELKEVDVAERAILTSSGNVVKIVGVNPTATDTVEETQIGKAIVVDSLPTDALCNVLLDANKKESNENGEKAIRPDIRELEGKLADAILIPNSKGESGSYLWSTLLQGDACLTVGNLASYRGSSMREFLTLNQKEQQRFLKQEGICGKNRELSCMVPVGDPKAKPNSDVVFPHGWSNRKDLNFVRVVNGQPVPRYTIDANGKVTINEDAVPRVNQ